MLDLSALSAQSSPSRLIGKTLAVTDALFVPIDEAFYAYHLLNFEAVFLVLFVPIGLSGALLPLLFHELRREVRELGSVAGRLYAWNTFGSLLGAPVRQKSVRCGSTSR